MSPVIFSLPRKLTNGPFQNYSRRAFTLVEILVTVAIIAILVALVIPAGTRAIESANSAKCASNLKQISAAAILYSADHDGKAVPICTDFPSAMAAHTYRAYLQLYLGDDPKLKVFVCPSDTWAKRQVILTPPAPPSLIWGGQPTSYGINLYAPTAVLRYPYHEYNGSPAKNMLISLPHPATTIFLCDTGMPDSMAPPVKDWTEKSRTISNASFGFANMPKGADPWRAGAFCIYPRHAGGRVNVAFYDGHVASLDLQKDVVDHPPGDPACLYDHH